MTGAGSEDETVTAAVVAWAPWVGAAAAAGVYAGDGQGTVFGMEARGVSVAVLVLTAVAWVALTRELRLSRATELFVGGGCGVLAVLIGYGAATAPLATVGWLALATGLATVFAAITLRRLRQLRLPAGQRQLAGFVVFAQALDGTTTAVGVDVLGYGEQSATPAAVLAFAAELPVAPIVGAGWLFVAVKVLLAVTLVGLFVAGEYSARATAAALGVTAFVGLGPAVHNIVLFTTG